MSIARRYLPSIAALTALEAVARLGTASAAAEELSLTQGAVSRQLRALEDQLGVALLIRERQRLALTPAAADYVAEVRKALGILSSAALTLKTNPRGGNLNLAILPAFGMHWLAPRLADFAARHPEVSVNLSTRLRPFDFATQPFDAAIHYGRRDWPGAAYLKLMEEEILAVAAPALVPRPLAAPQEVLRMPLLQLASRTGDWGRWLAHHGVAGRRPGGMLFDQFATMTQAAIHGLGLALLPVFLIERDLAEGRLVPVFGGPVRALGSYYLVWPEDRPARGPLESFRAWAAEEVGRER
ncbi:LysR family transcriptional regulator [Defluviimonas sp. 20V17]|uniref:LysR family transcriptional regulator n=1 Tax=Allgaiera indica TaxID=765699 RepID=A0AAN5A047_9RHOB|nr:LysR substrate-binding domain-containing protein [Allgaiera indica]KDB04611.1 LysR family transcriptional regulator [Defluviimonas sp. 20V17]GHE02597.1 LysR family transcriptional regulator [Allgaiera indica]SDX85213.1 transcriptional regulator, LysR family [Allgaiera indica]